MDGATLATWLKARLTGDRARLEWRSLLEAGTERVLDGRLGTLLPAAEVEALIAAWLTTDRIADAVRPVIRLGLAELVREARDDHEPLGRFVPVAARGKLLDLVSQKGLVHEEWVRQLYSQKAMEALVSETLYTALRDFSSIVPRIVQSVMPSALGKLASLGGKVAGAAGGRAFDEVEKRLEAEIRRFLELGTRKALDGAAKFTVEHIDDPVSLEARRNLASFVLGQSPSFHVRPATDERLAAIDELAAEIARYVAQHPDTRATLSRIVARQKASHAEKTVRAWLAELGATEPPPYDEWANLTWPALSAILEAPEVERWLGTLAAEIAELVSGGATPEPPAAG